MDEIVKEITLPGYMTGEIPFVIEFIFRFRSPDLSSFRYRNIGKVFIQQYHFEHLQRGLKKPLLLTEEFKAINEQAIDSYFASYKKGFIDGHTNFLNVILEKTAPFQDNRTNTTQIIFKYVTLPAKALVIHYIPKVEGVAQIVKTEDFYSIGITEGQKYRAWYYIIENPALFLFLFMSHEPFVKFFKSVYERYKNDPKNGWMVTQIKTALNDSTSPNSPTSIDDIKNNFDHVPIQTVFIHFKAGLVDKGYLSLDELYKYLNFAFYLKVSPDPLLKFKDLRARQKVIRVYNEYYKNIASKPFGKQKAYVALLTDYFTGYDIRNVSTNFSK